MTDYQPAAGQPHPLHTLVSWPAIIAGALVAVTVGAMLNLLGVALGAAALNPFDLSRGDAEGFTAGAGVWVAIANALALFVGGFVASRAAKYTDHHRGTLQGLSVWAVAFLIAILIAGSTAAGGVTSVLNGAAERADLAAPGYYDPDLGVVVDPMAPPSDAAPAVPTPAQPIVEDAGDATGAIALWAFVTMLLGGLAAVFGARYGGRRHLWETKVHVTEGVDGHVRHGHAGSTQASSQASTVITPPPSATL